MLKQLATGIRISYADLGDPGAAPLVLVTGAGGSKDGWGPLPDVLSTQHRVLTFDCRGLGDSGAGDGPLSLAVVADDIAALLDALELPRAHVLGWSFGAAVAQTFARRHRHRLGALVLWSTWARTDGYQRCVFTGLRYPVLHRDVETAVTTLGIVFSPGLLDSAARDMVVAQLKPLFPHTERQMQTTVEQWDAAIAHDVSEWLPAITAPTLVVAGEQDVLSPPRMGEEVARVMPGARYELFRGPGSSHALGLERIEEFGTLVLGFLAEHPLSGRAAAPDQVHQPVSAE